MKTSTKEEVVFDGISGICVQTKGGIFCYEDGRMLFPEAVQVRQRGSSLFFVKSRTGQTIGGKTTTVISRGSLEDVSIADDVVQADEKVVAGDSCTTEEETPKIYRLGEGCSISAIIHQGTGDLIIDPNFLSDTLDVMSTGDADICLHNANFKELTIVERGNGRIWRASADKLVATVEGNGCIMDMIIDKEARLKVKGTGSIEAESETDAEVWCSGDIGRITLI